MENFICQYCGKKCKNKNSLVQHTIRCNENPNKIKSGNPNFGNYPHKFYGNQFTKAKENGATYTISSETRQKLGKSWVGKYHTEEQKQKISESMKNAHKEGRAHNIGECRWNNKPSYPEKWFMKVIENEFRNKKYIREYPFNKYSLDFAWPEIKKCIEIDGEQHERFEEYKRRDNQKDKLLKENDWEILRISWKDCFNNPKIYIKIAKEFIDNGFVV